MDVGAQIRAAREPLGLTQQELAREVGVSSQHISRIEGGRVAPSLELLVRIARRLGVSTDRLLTGKDRTTADLGGAIRAQKDLTPRAKRALITLTEELSSSRPRR